VKRAERAPILERARQYCVPAVAVWFRESLERCLARNAARPPDEVADERGLRNVHAAIEAPSEDEGFASVWEVGSDDGQPAEHAVSLPASPEAEQVLRSYFRAKDGNRPHLLEAVFSPGAELVVRNQSANIAFPTVTRGRAAIAEVLVRSFALAYENIYSFYLDRPGSAVREFSCPWLVAMSERASGRPRVGCGTYAWSFDPQAPCLATRLVISIEAMEVLPASEAQAVFAWIGSLPYPWSSPRAALGGIPASELLLPVARFLRRHVAVD